jgi:hypothetical protein
VVVANLAILRLQAGRAGDALPLVERLRAGGSLGDHPEWGWLYAETLTRLGRWSQLAEGVRSGDVPGEAAMPAVARLLDRRRWDDALPLLRVTCPRLTGEDHTRCQRALTSLTPDR